MPKVTKTPKKRINLILILTLAVIALAGLIYFLYPTVFQQDEGVIEIDSPGWEQQAAKEQKPSTRESAAPEQAEQLAGQEPTAQPPGAPSAPPEAEKDTCAAAYAKLDEFFSYLDQQNYIAFFEFEGGTEKHFGLLLDKLYANPPVVVRETDSLGTILKNTAHFYRTLGRDNVFLIKDILDEESEIIEPTMADFYQWSLVGPDCANNHSAVRLPIDSLYEYASYFLNTLGGQSYLFRRPPRVRTLVKYYSVLVLDRANDQGLNQYGIDIRPHIESLIEDVEAIQNLTFQERYLTVLQNLKIKYQGQYGGP